MLTTRTALFAALSVAAALTLSSCAGGTPAATSSDSATTDSTSEEASASASTFNTADVTFAQMMIPHHEQAVEMSDDLLAKDGIDPRVVDLATEIKAAQQPEIERMQAWLAEWDAEEDSMGGMDHGSDGMMSDEDMGMLREASGADASKLFLQQMTLHHEGAVAMAELEIDDGENADAVALATDIVETQTAEIAVMADLLDSL